MEPGYRRSIHYRKYLCYMRCEYTVSLSRFFSTLTRAAAHLHIRLGHMADTAIAMEARSDGQSRGQDVTGADDFASADQVGYDCSANAFN